MTVNPHIETAVSFFDKIGEDFHNAMLWHVAHGIVLVSPEFLSVGYFCGKDELGTPLPVDQANTVFVTFMTGSMTALKRVCPEIIQFIAFRRGLKNDKESQVYDIEKFKQRIN